MGLNLKLLKYSTQNVSCMNYTTPLVTASVTSKTCKETASSVISESLALDGLYNHGFLQSWILEWVASLPPGVLSKPELNSKSPVLQADFYKLSHNRSPHRLNSNLTITGYISVLNNNTYGCITEPFSYMLVK